MPGGQDTVDAFITQIHDTEGVLDSALAFITGSAARIQAAVDVAISNGATAAQLQPVTDELAIQKAKADAVAAAIAANP